MRILNVTQSYAPFFEFGGPPAKVRALAEGLARKGHEVTVLTADWGLDRRLSASPNEPAAEHSPFGRRRKMNGVTAVYLANGLHYRAASWNPALGRYLRTRLAEFDVAHIFGLYDLLGPRVAAECRKRKIPYVVEPIGMFVPIVRNLWLKRMYHRIWGREMLAGASAIIATAEQEGVELRGRGVAGEKILLRRNGVEVPAELPERGLFRSRLKIPPDARLILFLGRMSQKKSPDLLLNAFAGLERPEGPNFDRASRVCGSGRVRDETQASADGQAAGCIEPSAFFRAARGPGQVERISRCGYFCAAFAKRKFWKYGGGGGGSRHTRGCDERVRDCSRC